MRQLPYRQRDRASRTGYIPADEDTLSLGLVTFPPEYNDYIEQEGGLWDPAHPAGVTQPADKSKKLASRPLATHLPPPPQAPQPAAVAGNSGSDADVESAISVFAPPAAQPGSGALGRLASIGSALVARLSGRNEAPGDLLE